PPGSTGMKKWANTGRGDRRAHPSVAKAPSQDRTAGVDSPSPADPVGGRRPAHRRGKMASSRPDRHPAHPGGGHAPPPPPHGTDAAGGGPRLRGGNRRRVAAGDGDGAFSLAEAGAISPLGRHPD